MSTIPRLVISAPSSGHGKTAVSVGLLAALSARGYRAAGFKIGPDHVDAAYLGLAAGRPGRNLDPRMVGAKRMGPLFAHGAGSLDIAVVEGTMGLFDGLAGRTDSESTAQISGLLRAPVILVVDVGAMGQSVAALVHGFRAYDELLWLGGVILNRVASTRHEQLLREALDDIGVPVLGALRRHALTEIGDAGAPLPSRHHGVAPVVHHNIDAIRAVRRLGEVIAGAVDIDRTMALARSAPRLTADPWSAEAEVAAAGTGDSALAAIAATRIGRRPVVGVAFAYPETAELLRAAGADVVPFDPLRDEALPDGVDGLVVGAALPESYAEELTFNGRLRSAVAAHAAAGKPIAAEGTGLVWLCRDFNGRPMCGVVDASARETDLVVLGYREATARSSSVLLPVGTQLVGHKMHRTTINPRAGLQAAWTWAGGPAEGFVQRGVHASYLGLHWAGTPSMASRFVAAASATAAPAPGVWTTPPTSPYNRPTLVPAPSAPPVGGVGVASTLPLPGTPAVTPVTAVPVSGGPAASPAPPGPFVPVSGPFVPAPAPQSAGAPPHGPLLPGSLLAGAPASPGPAAPYPGVQISSVPGAPAVAPGVAGPQPAADGVPASAPTSPGSSSPFGPALGPARPTPWTLTTPADAGSSASAVVSPAPAALDFEAADLASPGVELLGLPVSASAAAGAGLSGVPVSGAALPSAAVSSVPVSGAAAPSVPVSGAAVPGAAVSGVPVSGAAAPSVPVSGAAAPSVPVSGAAVPSAAVSSVPVSGAAVPSAAVSSVPVSGAAVPGAVPVSGGAAPVSGAAAPGAAGAGASPEGGRPSGTAVSGPWSAGPPVPGGAAGGSVVAGSGAAGVGDGTEDDDRTAVLPVGGPASGTIGAAGVSPATAAGGASVGVPSSANGPAQGGGLPSSGVVPTTVATSQPPQSTDARPPTPAQPVSTPPVTAHADEGRSANPATSAAMPVSSAPMAQMNAPVSAAPAGVTAMPASGSDLLSDEPVSHFVLPVGEGAGRYGPGAAGAADAAGQAPVSAPPDSPAGPSGPGGKGPSGGSSEAA